LHELGPQLVVMELQVYGSNQQPHSCDPWKHFLSRVSEDCTVRNESSVQQVPKEFLVTCGLSEC
jgi:hypothetical protein